MMEFRTEVWHNDEFSDWVRLWLPEIAGVMQAAAHFKPPDAEGYRHIGGFYRPQNREDVLWQLEFAVLPKLREWLRFTPKEDDRDPYEDETIAELRRKYPEANVDSFEYLYPKQRHYRHMVFPCIITLTLLAPVLSHAYLALRTLQESTWGETINAASTLGLLYLGEREVKINSLHSIVGKADNPFDALPRGDENETDPEYNNVNEDTMLDQSERSQHESSLLADDVLDGYNSRRHGKIFREFDPSEIPLNIWRGALQTLGDALTAAGDLTASLMRLAWELGFQHPFAEEIILVSMDVGYYSPLFHRAILQHLYLYDHMPEFKARIVSAWKRLLEREQHLSLNPALVQMLEDSLIRYGSAG